MSKLSYANEVIYSFHYTCTCILIKVQIQGNIRIVPALSRGTTFLSAVFIEIPHQTDMIPNIDMIKSKAKESKPRNF